MKRTSNNIIGIVLLTGGLWAANPTATWSQRFNAAKGIFNAPGIRIAQVATHGIIKSHTNQFQPKVKAPVVPQLRLPATPRLEVPATPQLIVPAIPRPSIPHIPELPKLPTPCPNSTSAPSSHGQIGQSSANATPNEGQSTSREATCQEETLNEK